MAVYEMDIGAVRNVICVPFRISSCLFVGSIDVLMWSIIRMNNSPIGGDGAYACPADYVNEEVCCARIFVWFYQSVLDILSDGRVLRRPALEAYVELSPME